MNELATALVTAALLSLAEYLRVRADRRERKAGRRRTRAKDRAYPIDLSDD